MKNWITTIFGILSLATTITGVVKQQVSPETALIGAAAAGGLFAAKDANKK